MRQHATIQSPGDGTLRVSNLQRMKCFYEEVLGFSVVGEFPNAVLLEISEKVGSRTRAIGLLKRSVRAVPEPGSRDDLAFTFPVEDCESERRRLENMGLQVEARNDDPVRRRSLYIRDPEGNRVELICDTEREQQPPGASGTPSTRGAQLNPRPFHRPCQNAEP